MTIAWRSVLVAVFVSVAANAGAQSLYGTLVGNVTDETGAALPGASGTVTQTETNLSRDVMTNESGGYTVPNLLPGTYEVAVTLQGFKSYTARGIAVRPDLVLRIDARLGIGGRHAMLRRGWEGAWPAGLIGRAVPVDAGVGQAGGCFGVEPHPLALVAEVGGDVDDAVHG